MFTVSFGDKGKIALLDTGSMDAPPHDNLENYSRNLIRLKIQYNTHTKKSHDDVIPTYINCEFGVRIDKKTRESAHIFNFISCIYPKKG